MTGNVSINITGSTAIGMAIIYAILAYFVYDRSIDAVVGVFIISIVISLIFLLSLMPIVGWIAALVITHFWALPWLLEYAGVTHTWLITLMYVLAAFSGLLITLAMCFVVIMFGEMMHHLRKPKSKPIHNHTTPFDRF